MAALQMTYPLWMITTKSPEETQAFGAILGALLDGGEVILLVGSLGAGKTTLTQGIAKGLEVDAYTKSPSFVLVNEYQGRLPLYHMDLYRIEDSNEAWDLGLDDYMDGHSVLVAEWGDRAPAAFPSDHLRIEIQVGSETQRTFTLAPEGPTAARLVERVSSRWPAVGAA